MKLRKSVMHILLIYTTMPGHLVELKSWAWAWALATPTPRAAHEARRGAESKIDKLK